MTKEQRAAEKLVRDERRRKRNALPGQKLRAQFRLEAAVLAALELAPLRSAPTASVGKRSAQ